MHFGITEFYCLLQNQGIVVVRSRISAGVSRQEGLAFRSMLSRLLTLSCQSTWLTGLLAYLQGKSPPVRRGWLANYGLRNMAITSGYSSSFPVTGHETQVDKIRSFRHIRDQRYAAVCRLASYTVLQNVMLNTFQRISHVVLGQCITHHMQFWHNVLHPTVEYTAIRHLYVFNYSLILQTT